MVKKGVMNMNKFDNLVWFLPVIVLFLILVGALLTKLIGCGL